MTASPAETAAKPALDVDQLHKLILQSLDDDQAQEVISIPLTGKSDIGDYMVIASGRSTRQVASMTSAELKKSGVKDFQLDYAIETLKRLAVTASATPPAGRKKGR